MPSEPDAARLTWPGRDAAFSTPPPAAHLRDVSGGRVDQLPDGHLLLVGDNLPALGVLAADFCERFDAIVIDPPYNTGRVDLYPDRYGGHADWLGMMTPRLLLARRLLRPEGALFVHIDHNEAAHLRLLLDEIFGEANRVAEIAVISNRKGRSDARFVASAHEALLVYQGGRFESRGLPLPDEVVGEYRERDARGRRFRLLGLRKRGSAARSEDRPNLDFPLWVDPDARTVSVEPSARHTVEVRPFLADGSPGRWRWSRDTVEARSTDLVARTVNRSGRWDVFQTDWLEPDGERRRVRPKSVWTDRRFCNDAGTRELKRLLGDVGFPNPKPVALVRECLEQAAGPGAWVLDFFAGTGTTGQAVLEMNADDGSRRRCVLVQEPRPTPPGSRARASGHATIADICAARLAAVGGPTCFTRLEVEATR